MSPTHAAKKYQVVFLRSVRQLLVAACVVPSAPIFVTLMKEAPGSSETSVLTRATWRNNPEDTILHKIGYFSHAQDKPFARIMTNFKNTPQIYGISPMYM
jgi:hypothetical protein